MRRAAVFNARHSEIVRCAKSRRTPTPLLKVSIAQLNEVVVPAWKRVRLRTYSQIAGTRAYPFGISTNACGAIWKKRSGGQ